MYLVIYAANMRITIGAGYVILRQYSYGPLVQWLVQVPLPQLRCLLAPPKLESGVVWKGSTRTSKSVVDLSPSLQRAEYPWYAVGIQG